ncbi:MAG: proline--tRNA ligase [Bacilli bacterium]|nr:proline--tRNA ligase [Bacilli bacterium]
MKLKHSYFYTLREETKSEESTSGNLLTRAGMIKKSSSGVYMFLPLGYKVVKNVEKIIREELESINAGELLMPALIPEETYVLSGRRDAFGSDMFQLKDRFDKAYVLAPTHEELFTIAAKARVKSYKDLPFSIYQIQDKFRDEPRSRYGLIRVREFLMKDAYSFDANEKGLNDSYNEMYNAYKKIFARLGINYKIVKSDTGAMGGILSEEFQAITPIGEDKLVICDECGYASNADVAKCTLLTEKSDEELKPRELIKTPNVGTIEEVSNFLNEDKGKFVKTLIYKIDGNFYAVLVKGTHEVNEAKLKKLMQAKEVVLAEIDEVEEVTKAKLGFAGPVGLEIPIILDNEIMNMVNFVVGANKTDYHYKNVNLEDFNYLLVGDVRCITEHDSCPSCGKKLNFKNGIEVGNTFKLGTKYSEALNLTYLDKNNVSNLVWMGCYGIGIGRCIASVVEQHNDDKGIIWPMEIAPFKVSIVVVNTGDQTQMDAANYLYSELRKNGISTILDDREERAGVKFNDADLIGIPIRITVGNKIRDHVVEIKERRKDGFEDVSLYDALTKVEDIIDGD